MEIESSMQAVVPIPDSFVNTATLKLSQEKVAHTIEVSNRAKMLAAFWFALGAAKPDRPVLIEHSDGRKWTVQCVQ